MSLRLKAGASEAPAVRVVEECSLEQPTPPPAPSVRRIDNGTAQQEALWRSLVEDGQHVMAEARAGCGKSSSCREGMWRMLERTRSLAIRYSVFNRANAQEFAAECPPGVEVGTLHRFGFGACRQAWRSELDKNKTYLILDESPAGRNLPRYLRKAVAALVSLAKNANLPPPASYDDEDRLIPQLEELLLHYDVRTYGQPGRVCDWAVGVLRRSCGWTELLDFDDMIWLPAQYGLEFPGADVVFVDECQDLNPAQHALLPLLTRSGRVVAVGDRYQAVYGFRGAAAESVPLMEAQLGRGRRGLNHWPLTVTFRCPKSHVELAREFVADFTAHASNPDGIVERDRPLDDLLARARPGDRIICPQNAPVVQAALQLIAGRRRAVVRGRALGEQLCDVLRQCGECRTVAEVAKKVCQWKAKELAHLEGLDGVEDVVESVNDRAAGLQAVLSACDSPAEAEPLIRSLFSDGDPAGVVQCSTIHRAKGLEARTVWYIDAPMKEPKRPWEAQQQRNLRYVGLTRSRERLVFVAPEC